MGYSVFFTYMLVPSGATNDYGYKKGIHCNYINSLQIDSLSNNEVNIVFKDINDFKFLAISGGTGYTASKIIGIIQVVDNSLFLDITKIAPDPSKWKKYDLTSQITNSQNINYLLTADDLVSTVFRFPLNTYNNMEIYDLSYLNYPNKLNETGLCFGDEEMFFGNVSTHIQAIAYSTDIQVYLQLGNFNSSTNKTWDESSDVYISEVGIYDADQNLVGIAKLNNPISKNETIARTIVFGIDF